MVFKCWNLKLGCGRGGREVGEGGGSIQLGTINKVPKDVVFWRAHYDEGGIKQKGTSEKSEK